MDEKPVLFLGVAIKTPPFTEAGRREAGRLLRALQEGETVGMPRARPMPGIGPRCLELRVRDEEHNWRIVVRVDAAVIVVADVFAKTTAKTPKTAIGRCRRRLAVYDRDHPGGA